LTSVIFKSAIILPVLMKSSHVALVLSLPLRHSNLSFSYRDKIQPGQCSITASWYMVLAFPHLLPDHKPRVKLKVK